MHRLIRILMIAALVCYMAIAISCDSGGSSGGAAESSGGGNASAEATFVVDVKVCDPNHSLTGNPATGTAATWSLTGENYSSGYTKFVCYRYTIGFSGGVAGLPDGVQVTINWVMSQALEFRWGTANVGTSTETYTVPKTGGSIGTGGSVANLSPGRRPYIVWHYPTVNSIGQDMGTVIFSAPGVKTLVLRIKNANYHAP